MEHKNPIQLKIIFPLLLAAAFWSGCSEEKKAEPQLEAPTNKSLSLENRKRVLQSHVVDPTPPAPMPTNDVKKAVNAFRNRLHEISGTPTNDELKTKAESGDVTAQLELGRSLLRSSDFKEALEWFRKAADQGSASAQHDIGNMYVLGQGVEKDMAESVKWFTKAAEQGDTDSEYALGLRYAGGTGVEQDFAQAVKWYSLAANKGSMYAQAGLAIRYEKGQGVAPDKSEAYKWYDLAAQAGHFNAGDSRDKL